MGLTADWFKLRDCAKAKNRLRSKSLSQKTVLTNILTWKMLLVKKFLWVEEAPDNPLPVRYWNRVARPLKPLMMVITITAYSTSPGAWLLLFATSGRTTLLDRSLLAVYIFLSPIRNVIAWLLFLDPVFGMAYPAFGLVVAKGIEGFTYLDARERRHAGDRNALWLFVISILSTISIGLQNYLFAYASSILTARLRTLSLKSLLRQDIEFFDQEKNSARKFHWPLFCVNEC